MCEYVYVGAYIFIYTWICTYMYTYVCMCICVLAKNMSNHSNSKHKQIKISFNTHQLDLMPHMFTHIKEELPVKFEKKNTKQSMIQKRPLVKHKTNTHTDAHTRTHNYKHIKYQRRVKKTKVNILQEGVTKTLIKPNSTRQESFILETGVSPSFIEYPI